MMEHGSVSSLPHFAFTDDTGKGISDGVNQTIFVIRSGFNFYSKSFDNLNASSCYTMTCGGYSMDR